MQASASYFQVNPSSGVPIYRQLMDQVRARRQRAVGGRGLAPVRAAGRPGPASQPDDRVQGVFAAGARRGRRARLRGHGMRVNHKSPRGTIKERQNELRPLLEQVATQAYQLALTREQVLAALDPLLKERGNE